MTQQKVHFQQYKKIANKAQVKFSTVNYVDIVDYAISPLSACHLLLGRLW
jgi:hypothetical protein